MAVLEAEGLKVFIELSSDAGGISYCFKCCYLSNIVFSEGINSAQCSHAWDFPESLIPTFKVLLNSDKLVRWAPDEPSVVMEAVPLKEKEWYEVVEDSQLPGNFNKVKTKYRRDYDFEITFIVDTYNLEGTFNREEFSYWGNGPAVRINVYHEDLVNFIEQLEKEYEVISAVP